MSLRILSCQIVRAGLAGILVALSGCATSPPAQEKPQEPEPKVMAVPAQVAAQPTSAESAVVAAEKQAAPVELSEENNIYFGLGSTKVDATGERKLREHAAKLVSNRKAIVTLTGLTDNSGSRSVNLLIAEQRVEAVAKILRSLGVPRGQIRTYALGTRTSRVSCESVSCRDKMRRVELTYED